MPALKWWETAVIYQIYPRSFQDSNGDGIGDLAGITTRLDYIAGLGVDAIWISPFYMSPQADFGYDVSDYCDVNPDYGTLADFDRLVEQAHALGLKVIIDIVPAHCSDQHAWFQQAGSHVTMTWPPGSSGPTRCRMDRRQQTGCPFLAAEPGVGNRAASNIIFTTSFPSSQPQSRQSSCPPSAAGCCQISGLIVGSTGTGWMPSTPSMRTCHPIVTIRSIRIQAWPLPKDQQPFSCSCTMQHS